MNSVYCFTNLINNKKYIGSTVQQPTVRYSQHLYNATHINAHQYDYPLYQAIRKYGIQNFSFKVLEQKECSEEEIRELEQKYIINLNTLSPNGYNQTLDTKHPINDIVSYQKMSKTKRNNAQCVAEVDKNNNILQIWNSIIDCAESTGLNQKKIAACCRGEIHTTQNRIFYWVDDSNNLIIPTFKGNNIYKGKQGTTQKQKTNRKVAKYDFSGKEMIQVYDSIALAARENNCDASGISKTCRGTRGQCGGFVWRYIDE